MGVYIYNDVIIKCKLFLFFYNNYKHKALRITVNLLIKVNSNSNLRQNWQSCWHSILFNFPIFFNNIKLYYGNTYIYPNRIKCQQFS